MARPLYSKYVLQTVIVVFGSARGARGGGGAGGLVSMHAGFARGASYVATQAYTWLTTNTGGSGG